MTGAAPVVQPPHGLDGAHLPLRIPRFWHEALLAAESCNPEGIAILADDVALSYRGLALHANAFAAALDELGVGAGDRVVVLADSCPWSIAVCLGCSIAGAVFVPVSPSLPSGRRDRIIELSDAQLVVRAAGSSSSELTEASSSSETATLQIADTDVVVTSRHRLSARRHYRPTATDAAYIVFTSGTTGDPKGIVMSHRAILAFYAGLLETCALAPGAVLASTSPLQFDFSLLDLGLALGSGATFAPVPRHLLHQPKPFVAWLKRHDISQVDGVPSIWRPVLRYARDELSELRSLRTVLFAGEEFPIGEIRLLQDTLPVALINCFGHSESVACSFTHVDHPLPRHTERLSIGRGMPGAELFLWDADRECEIRAAGEAGELYLRSDALFSGYWRDPAATRRSLVPDPRDPASPALAFRTGDLAMLDAKGEFSFLGRRDAQVQVGGNRVELEEVERCVARLSWIGSVAAFQIDGDDPQLVAAITADQVPDQARRAIWAHCIANLPAYMAPADVFVVPEIPLTTNGKSDRRALRALAEAGQLTAIERI